MVRFYLSQYQDENVVIRALYDGCPEEKKMATLDFYEPADVSVVMGVYKKKIPASYKRGQIIAQQAQRGLDTLILETGYIHRGNSSSHYYALGWNGLNGRAEFCNAGSPGDRAEKLHVTLKDRQYGEDILLCGQVPHDASVDFSNHQQWLLDAVENIQSVSGRNIVFRPHPLAKLPNMPGCQYSTGRTLLEDLKNAHCVVTFNSNSGVEALIEGVPVFAFDEGAMYWDICNKDWLDLENPKFPDRTQWLNNLAYAQWNCEELRSGEAWAHISEYKRSPALT